MRGESCGLRLWTFLFASCCKCVCLLSVLLCFTFDCCATQSYASNDDSGATGKVEVKEAKGDCPAGVFSFTNSGWG